jgi:hypothetical protein
MFYAMDATDPLSAFFFIATIEIGYHIIVQLLIGVIITSLQEEISSKLNDVETKSMSSLSSMSSDGISDNMSVDDAEENVVGFAKFRKNCRHIIYSKYFMNGMLMITIFNAVILSMAHKDQGADWDRYLELCNTIFNWIFIVEMTFKVFALGPKCYLQSRWNIMDCIFSLFGIVELFALSGENSITSIRTIR